MQLIINKLPPSVNHAYSVKRGGLYMKSNAKKFMQEVQNLAKEEAKKQGHSFIAAGEFFFLDVYFQFANRRHPDPNNMLKILIDSLEGVLFENDKYCMPRIMNCQVTGKNETKVVVHQKNNAKEREAM